MDGIVKRLAFFTLFIVLSSCSMSPEPVVIPVPDGSHADVPIKKRKGEVLLVWKFLSKSMIPYRGAFLFDGYDGRVLTIIKRRCPEQSDLNSKSCKDTIIKKQKASEIFLYPLVMEVKSLSEDELVYVISPDPIQDWNVSIVRRYFFSHNSEVENCPKFTSVTAAQEGEFFVRGKVDTFCRNKLYDSFIASEEFKELDRDSGEYYRKFMDERVKPSPHLKVRGYIPEEVQFELLNIKEWDIKNSGAFNKAFIAHFRFTTREERIKEARRLKKIREEEGEEAFLEEFFAP